MSRNFKPLGTWPELKEQLLSTAVDRALFSEVDEIRTRDAFVAIANDGWRRLSVAAAELNSLAREILQRYHEVRAQLDRTFPPLLLGPVTEMRQQLDRLVSKQFLQSTPPAWLPHLPRYLRALAIRLQKLMNAGLNRDQQVAAQISPLSEAYRNVRSAKAIRGIIDPQLEQFRWMLEELRVSLYAQELKTVASVSIQRLERQLSLLSA